MKTIKLMLCCAMILGGITFVQAQKNKKSKTKKSKKEFVQKNDTVSTDSFSYILGIMQSNDLLPYLNREMDVDLAYLNDFEKGFKDFINSSDSVGKKYIAYAAGANIAKQVRERVLKSTLYQITADENTRFIKDDKVIEGFLDGLMNRIKNVPKDSVRSIFGHQAEYFERKKIEEAQNFMVNTLKQNPDLKQLKDGVLYRVIVEGKGSIPTDTNNVVVDYEGRLINGKIFDSSYKRGEPATFGVTQVIKGWQEALKAMPEGSVWEIYIPQEMAYGYTGTRGIPPFSPLIFKVELKKVLNKTTPNQREE